MSVIVFGATGKTGQHVLHAALAQGHEVTAFGRSIDRLDIDDPALQTHKGDVFDTPRPTLERAPSAKSHGPRQEAVHPSESLRNGCASSERSRGRDMIVAAANRASFAP